jgi:hypothetical protein
MNMKRTGLITFPAARAGTFKSAGSRQRTRVSRPTTRVTPARAASSATRAALWKAIDKWSRASRCG